MKSTKILPRAVRFFSVICVITLLLQFPSLFAANVVWVSDNGPAGFSGPVANSFDDPFITNLLQVAGHNVIRFNGPDSQNTLLTPEEIAALNTNDLIMIGRAVGSPAFQSPQGEQWNTAITKPMIVMSAYLVRNSRMGFFSGNDTVPDASPGPLRVTDLTNPNTAYLFGGVAMNGDTMADNFDEPVDRNISIQQNPIVAGGVILASNVNGNLGVVIAEVPAGTVVKGGANTLAAYRMFLGVGSREASGAVQNAGKENLTAAGEDIFIRAVNLALNGGVPPNIVYEPIVIGTQPQNQTVNEGAGVSFSVEITAGNLPRYQWYFNGAPIPSANLPTLSMNPVQTTNAGEYFVVITNGANAVTSEVATLTVVPDTTPPTIVSSRASTLENIIVIFSEPMDPVSALGVQNYTVEAVDGSDLLFPSTVISNTPTSVTVVFSPGLAPGVPYKVVVGEVRDTSAAMNLIDPNPSEEIIQLPGTAHGNIVWVSDNPGPNGFSGPIAGFEDDVFVTNFLQTAGYNVIRYSSDNAATNLLSAEDIAALNTNDLIIVSRSTGSGAFNPPQATQWNTAVTKPMIVMSSYLLRTNNLSWFLRSDVPDDTQTTLTTTNLSDPETAYIFQDVAMNGNTTYDTYDFPLDRNTSMITGPTVPGGVVIATAAQNGATAIAEFPAGTAVRSGTEILAAYRMFFAGGSRETTSVTTAGKDNLTPTGEALFLRAVEVALAGGNIGGTNGAAQPTITNPQFAAGSFSASFLSENGVNYEVQYKNDLSAVGWTTLTTISGDGTVKTFTDAAFAADPMRFYRIVIP